MSAACMRRCRNSASSFGLEASSTRAATVRAKPSTGPNRPTVAHPDAVARQLSDDFGGAYGARARFTGADRKTANKPSRPRLGRNARARRVHLAVREIIRWRAGAAENPTEIWSNGKHFVPIATLRYTGLSAFLDVSCPT